jgi:hypothetical protein
LVAAVLQTDVDEASEQGVGRAATEESLHQPPGCGRGCANRSASAGVAGDRTANRPGRTSRRATLRGVARDSARLLVLDTLRSRVFHALIDIQLGYGFPFSLQRCIWIKDRSLRCTRSKRDCCDRYHHNSNKIHQFFLSAIPGLLIRR